jgi:hypothetical protein
MPVVPLTLTISLTLVFTFVIFFLREHTRGRVSSAERDSLLPLGEEGTQLARVHAHGKERSANCGCGDGRLCAACLKRKS